MAFDVFISYASKDKIVADAVCARLEFAGIRCWIAPRDIVAGTSYGEAIIEAIHSATVMVLVFSSNANASGHIPKEVERAVSKGLAIIPFRIEGVAPGKSLDYFIGSVHWLDAITPPMEKHLDDLATTIRKLIPLNAGEQGAPGAQTPGVWQGSMPAIAPIGAPVAAVRPAGSRETSHASSLKTIWIGVTAVAVLAGVVMGTMLLRGGGNSHSAAEAPGTTNPSSAMGATSNSNPASDAGAPIAARASQASTPPGQSAASSKMALPPSSAAVAAGADPIVGCYQWFNNASVVIRADGTMVGGPFTAHWRLVNAAERAYTFTWPEATDTVTISPDQRSLSGANQYGFPTSGTRIAGSSGLVGTWQWPNNVPVTVYPNGAFSAASFRGTWKAVDASLGIYALTWPDPVDSVALSADGSRVSGANQYGVAISGVRTQPCAEN